MTMADRKTIDLEQGWDFMQKGIKKLINILEGVPEQQFNSEEYIMLYTTIYNMCTQKPPQDYSQQLYDRYRESFEDYINQMVLPALREKHDEFMLRELVKRWENHKIMVRWLSRFFNYLDRYFVARRSLPVLNEVGLTCFRDLVYQEIRNNVKDAVIALIDREREGEQIDRALLKNVLGIFVEIGMGSMDFYEKDFEVAMLEDTASNYSRKAASWILEDSCPDYMRKAEECLKQEKERVAHYLHSSSEQKLLEKVQNELLSQYESQLLEKEHSGCHALLRDDKVYDLSRMYRLFYRIPKGLEPVAQIFKQHVTGELTSLVKHAEDAATNEKAEKKNMVGAQEQAFVRKVIEVHDKYLKYVNDCFMNHSLFDKALKEAFEAFEVFEVLLATFCDNILKNGGSEKLSNEDTLEKAVKLLTYISDKDLFAEFYGNSGCNALLRDDKVDDLSRMYRLFYRIPKCLEPVAQIFKQHATGELTSLVKHAEEAATDEKAEKNDMFGAQEQAFVRKVIELHDKHLQYVHECFMSDSLFDKALKEAFEVFCNKGVAGSASVELLATFCDNIFKKGGSEKLSDEDIKDTLEKVVKLILNCMPKCLEPMAQVFKQHVTDEVTLLVKHAENAATNKKAEKDLVGAQEQAFVRKVIELHDKYLQYVHECFMNDSLFDKALKEAFDVFCNKGVAGSTSAELLATFCDNLLKKGGSEKLSDEDIEVSLEKVVKLLAYISNKDLFAEFYRKKLARRLLFDKSANDDLEKSILTKLKQQCGGQFTSKMEGMLTDLTLAKENQGNFEEYLNENPHAHPGIDLTVTVLTTGFWPSYKSFDLNLPAEMVKCVEVFKEFYQTKTKHRKLTWLYSLGTCDINVKFDPKPMELIVSTYQASALLLFNASERLSYSEIKSQLNLTNEDIVRLLHSLSCAKHKILNKEPKTKTVAQTDYFEFNAKFTDKMRRIKILLPPVDEKKKVIEDVDKDKRYAIDASIVRIMKSRKVLAQQQLVMECAEQLGRMSKPDFKAIKKRIEDLITREYLERDKDNPNTFRYLA